VPFQLFTLPSYERCLKKLSAHQRETAGLIVSALTHSFESGLPLTGRPHVIKFAERSYRFIFKRLRGQIWEAYLEGHLRILTRLENNSHYLVFVGNHDQVRQFLKEN